DLSKVDRSRPDFCCADVSDASESRTAPSSSDRVRMRPILTEELDPDFPRAVPGHCGHGEPELFVLDHVADHRRPINDRHDESSHAVHLNVLQFNAERLSELIESQHV